MKITAKDLRTHARRILEAVDREQEGAITHRGKARAKIVSYVVFGGREGAARRTDGHC